MTSDTKSTRAIIVSLHSKALWGIVRRRGALFAAAGLVAALAVSGALASAATPSVAWQLQSLSRPTHFQLADSENPHTQDRYTVSALNVGSADSSGMVTVTDILPVGVTTSATPRGEGEGTETSGGVKSHWECTPGAGNSVVACTSTVPVPALTPTEAIEIPVSVASFEGGPLGANEVQISGGGAPECGGPSQPACASASSPTVLSAQTPSFGLVNLSSSLVSSDGTSDTQAGDHPSALTTSFDLATATTSGQRRLDIESIEPVKQIVVDLPAGLVGNPQAAPSCSLSDLADTGFFVPGRECAAATQVGVLQLMQAPGNGGIATLPIYNVTAERGHPAEFGLHLRSLQRSALLYASVRPGPDYGIRVMTQNLNTFVPPVGVSTTFFGNPVVKNNSSSASLAFFTNPADCSGEPLTVTVHVDSWVHPGRMSADGSPDFSDPNWKSSATTLPPVGGCDALQFTPSIGFMPETTQAGSPSGYAFDLSVPVFSDPSGLATPPLKRATVTLPEGVSVSPSSADGLQACSDAQFDVGSIAPAGCSLASQVATVTARTPILSEPVVGQVFVGSPDCSPCSEADAREGHMLRLFMQVQIPSASLKFPGSVSVDPVTGRLTATFAGLIQQPVSDIQLQFKGGPRAPLANPRGCGVSTTTSDLEPWSAPFTVDGTPSSSFETTGCGDPGLFSPSFVAGTVSNQAGAFSPFSVSFSRTDQDQELGGMTVKTPPGLLGILKGVERCGEPQASQGTCGAGSLIGHATASAGPGSHPFTVQGAQVFLTGPYKGAPFGLSIVVPAVAGPFNLGNVVVRAAVNVDPHTAQITVASDPLPRIIDGIPLQIKTVTVSIDREGFMFNPTSCDPLSVGGTLTSTQGANANVSSRFQAAGCAGLAFKPSFKVSTQAKTSKKDGASLDVKVGYTSGAQANIAKVTVSLPKQLPSRLTTIQQACPEATFNENPASCPAGSVIGTATANTPVLANPVTGPAYLVSHGGAAFPDLVLILQGEGVKLELIGSIDIKHGVTSSAFNSVPDAPISTFELKLPEGPHSGLAAVLPAKAKGSLCGTRLTMPTTLTGQNGATLKQATKITVGGCPKPTRRAHGKKKAKAKKQRKVKKSQGKKKR